MLKQREQHGRSVAHVDGLAEVGLLAAVGRPAWAVALGVALAIDGPRVELCLEVLQVKGERERVLGGDLLRGAGGSRSASSSVREGAEDAVQVLTGCARCRPFCSLFKRAARKLWESETAAGCAEQFVSAPTQPCYGSGHGEGHTLICQGRNQGHA